MIRSILHRVIRRFESQYGYDATYMHEIADASIAAFFKLALAQAMNTHRESISLDALHAARIAAARFEDCGPCAQLVVNMALEAGVAPAMVRAIVARDLPRLSSDAALGLRLTDAVLAHESTDGIRQDVIARFGDKGLITLAYSIAATRIYPTMKRALGPCAYVRTAARRRRKRRRRARGGMMLKTDPAREFEAHRSRLIGLGYRMLGSVAEAEDLVQETYVRWHRATREEIREPGAWLSTTMTRMCIDSLRARKVRREQYVGPWLPEPWRTGESDVDDAPRQLELADDLSVAFLLLLERLGPDERAAFLLHDIFEADYEDIATSLGKSEPAVRQLVSRARTRVAEDRKRFRATRADQQQLIRRFKEALVTKDEHALVALFKPDATLLSDGGGKALAALRPIYGSDKIVRFFIGVTKDQNPADFVFEDCWLNNAPAILIRELSGTVFATLALEVDDGRITTVYTVRNPDKLDRLGRTSD